MKPMNIRSTKEDLKDLKKDINILHKAQFLNLIPSLKITDIFR